MSLIQCRNCGKNISDSAKVCPHCGFDFSEEQRKKECEQEYSRMSVEKQKQLRNDYDAIYPAYRRLVKRQKKLLCVSLIGLAVAWLSIMVANFVKSDSVIINWVIILAVSVFLLPSAILYIFLVIDSRTRCVRKRLENLKRFQTWLLQTKNITYHVVLTEKEKRYFDLIQQ